MGAKKRQTKWVEAFITAGTFPLLHRAGFLGDMHFGSIVALLLVAVVANRVVRGACSSEDSGVQIHARMAVQQLTVGSIIYAIGWGPALCVGFIVVVADDLRISGSRRWRSAVAWTLVAIVAGQAAVAAGIVSSYVEEPAVHGLGVLAALGTAFVIRLLGLKSAEVEREIADRVEAEESLFSSEQRFRALAQNASDIVLVADADAMITYISPSVEPALGYAPEEMTGTFALDYLHPEDVAPAHRALEAIFADPASTRRLELRVRHADGTYGWYDFSTQNLLHDPYVCGIVVNFRDVTDRRARRERLAHEATHDSLTGLSNRAAFHEQMKRALARVARRRSSAAVLFCDVDGFKLVNDGLGHHVGDGVLVELARRLLAAVRPADSVGRLAGDEFTVLLEDLQDPDEAEAVAQRICSALAMPMAVDGQELTVTMSIGFAVASEADTVETLLRRADVAMYEAKNTGGARVVRYEEVATGAAKRTELESSLRRAIQRSELRLHYQPIISMADGEVVGVEALVRWQHPERGLLSPDAFIPLAEASGLIAPLGRWVLDEACRTAAGWHDGPVVTVNVSSLQLRDSTVVEDVRHALESSGLSAERLVLELTESALADTDQALTVLEALRQMGVRLLIDDFGTGYSSLAYLSRFPVNGMKIDREFVIALGTPSGDRMVKILLELARGMDLWVVAEGIESAEQARLLVDFGCGFGQGFHIGRPNPIPAAPPPDAGGLVPLMT